MTLRQANYNSHFLVVPALLSARGHRNTTVQFRTLNFHLPREFRFRAAPCSTLEQGSSFVASVGAGSCERYMSGRFLTLRKSKDGLRQARTDLSKRLWGRFAGSSGPRKPMLMWPRFVAAIRAMRAGIWRGKSLSRPSCSPPSTSKSPGATKRRAF